MLSYEHSEENAPGIGLEAGGRWSLVAFDDNLLIPAPSGGLPGDDAGSI